MSDGRARTAASGCCSPWPWRRLLSAWPSRCCGHHGVRGRRPDRQSSTSTYEMQAQRRAAGDRDDRLAVRRRLGPARHRALLRHPRAVRRRAGRGLQIDNIDGRPARTRRGDPVQRAGPTRPRTAARCSSGSGSATRTRRSPPPTATYVISYEVKGAMRTFSGYDEFYWDATGFEDGRRSQQASVTASVPGGAQERQLFRRSGRRAPARARPTVATVDRPRSARPTWPPGRGSTIGVKIKSGLIGRQRAAPGTGRLAS